MALYLLFESAPAYALFHAHGIDQIGQNTEAVRSSVDDLNRFGKVVQLTAFHPFESALDGLTQINAVSEGIMTDELRNFLELNLPKVKEGKKPKFSLGVSEPKVGSHISEETKIPCQCNDFIHELLRGVRMHFDRFIKDLKAGDTEKAQLGLGHSYSRAKVKFNVNRVDNMVIQAISILDTVDKDINSFSMRIREWYSWHFPELVKIISDNYQYAKVAMFVRNKSDLSEGNATGLTDILGDEDKAREIIEASKSSMGQDISPIDLINVHRFAEKVICLSQYRHRLYDYLATKMNGISPNLASLIGEVIGARLISHAGSLANLAKCPASTLQILGAEKALFRALKTRGSTPKYGLIFHSSFIGKASSKNKGRMARFLSNKCSIASRIDCYMDYTTATFGERLREQVEERLEFYDKGVAPRKNIDVMKAAMEGVQNREMDESEDKSKVTNRDASEPMEEDEPASMTSGDAKSEKNKKNKDKREQELEAEREQDAAVTNGATKSEKKDKRKLEQELDAEQDLVTASNASSKEIASKKKKKCKEGNGDHLQATGEVKKKKKKSKSEGL